MISPKGLCSPQAIIFFRITLSNVPDKSKEANDFVLDNKIDNNDTNTDVDLLS